MPTLHTTPADEAVAELRSALAAAGITLPSLGVDLVSLGLADNGANPPLVSLGRCTAETARALADALKEADR